MCRLVVEKASAGGTFYRAVLILELTQAMCPDPQVIADARRIAGEANDSAYVPTDAQEFANRIFHTCYMGTVNSSEETRQRAKALAEAIGRSVKTNHILGIALTASSYHTDLNMDTIVAAVHNLFSFVTGIRPRFRTHGGSQAENLALQNIQVC